MYLNILKKDLKRKKTMNVILLIFVMLSAMFMASSVNNIIAVTTGLDSYFEKAGMADYYVLKHNSDNDTMGEALSELDCVSDYRREDVILFDTSNVEIDGKPLMDQSKTSFIMSIDDRQLNYYTPDNKELTEVKKGTAYISGNYANEAKLEKGDKFTLVMGEHKVELIYMGRAKDALLGSDFMGNPRFILNEEDYKHLRSDEKAKAYDGSVYYIDTTDVSKVEATVGEHSGILFNADNSIIKTSYIMSMIVAALLIIVSVFLIVISFIVLKHTIAFTLDEEFREIGVMKAIGMKNSSIRVLYLTKYFAITVIGSVFGFALSMPFSDFLLNSVTTSMYIDSKNSFLVAALCSVAVVGLTLLFCWRSTGKIKKLTPIDAVRNGQTGERFRKKSLMHLSKSKLGSNTFLAANDIVSAPKKYAIISVAFAMLMLLVMILANTANTLNSDKILFLLGATKSDAYYMQINGVTMECLSPDADVQAVLKNAMKEVEHKLSENGISGKVHAESIYNTTVLINDTKTAVPFQYCPDTKASDYIYGEGVAPQNANEVALSYLTAEKLGIGIGDNITFLIDGQEQKCMVTALFQTFNRLGIVCRLHEDFDVSKLEYIATNCFQIDFDDELSKAEAEERIEKLKNIFDSKEVYNCEDYVAVGTGAAEALNDIKNLVLIIVLVIVILVAVLMERSFISAEKAEIALMKAIGFSNKSIIWHHTLRFGIVAFISSMLAAVLCMPLTKLVIDPIMGVMGAVSGVGYEIVPAEIFLLYPAILVAVTIIAAFFTSIYTNTIKSSDASNIE